MPVQSGRRKANRAGATARYRDMAPTDRAVPGALLASSSTHVAATGAARGRWRRGPFSARDRGWLAQLVESHDFSLVFQPIFDLSDGSLFAAEALVRFSPWSSKSPDAVIAHAHQLGLGVELEAAIVEAAIEHVHELPGDALLAVNVGPLALVSEAVLRALAEGEPGRLIVELTEHASLDGDSLLVEALAQLHADGVRLAIDDPGIRLAVMAGAAGPVVAFIKADCAERATSVSAPSAPPGPALLRRARARDASIIAERIETAATLAAVQQLGIRYGQGFHLAHPAPASELQDAVRRGALHIAAQSASRGSIGAESTGRTTAAEV